MKAQNWRGSRRDEMRVMKMKDLVGENSQF